MSVHMLAARAIAPIVLAIIYGIYELIARGASSDFYLYTYVAVKPFAEETFKQIGSPARLVARQLARRLESDRRGPQ